MLILKTSSIPLAHKHKVNFDPRTKNHVNFDPHIETEFISILRLKNHVIFDSHTNTKSIVSLH